MAAQAGRRGAAAASSRGPAGPALVRRRAHSVTARAPGTSTSGETPMTTLKFSIRSDAPESAATPCLVVGMHEERVLGAAAQRVDATSGGAIRRLVESGDASGKAGTSIVLFGLPGVAAERVLVVGLGDQKKFDAAAYHRAVNDAARALK